MSDAQLLAPFFVGEMESLWWIDVSELADVRGCFDWLALGVQTAGQSLSFTLNKFSLLTRKLG